MAKEKDGLDTCIKVFQEPEIRWQYDPLIQIQEHLKKIQFGYHATK